MATDIEIAWAAGLFEGEGCMTIPKKGRPASLRAQMRMTDFDVVRRFHGIVEVGECTEHTAPSNLPHWKPALTWYSVGASALGVIALLSPFFGERRGGKAAECIEWYSRMFVKSCRRCERKFVAGRTDTVFCSELCARRTRQGHPYELTDPLIADELFASTPRQEPAVAILVDYLQKAS